MTPPDDDRSGAAKPRGRYRRWLLWTGAGLVGTGVLAVAGLRWAATTDWGRNLVTQRIEAMAPAGQSIEISGLEGDLFGTFEIGALAVSDGEGEWLSAETILVDWSPWDLFWRRLDVSLVDIETLHVDRRPALEGDDEDGSSGGELPLHALGLGRLRIGALSTGADLTGQPATFALSASLEAASDTATIQAALVPENAAGDRLTADFQWQAGAPPRGTIEIEAPAGGLIGTLAQLPEDQAMTANLNAVGVGESWELTADVAIAEATAATARVAGGLASANGTASIILDSHPLGAPIAARIGRDLKLDLSWQDDSAGDRITLTAESSALAASVSRARTDRNAPFVFAVDLGDLASSLAVPGLDGDRLRINGTLQPSPSAPWTAEGSLAFEGLDTPSGPVGRLDGPFTATLGGFVGDGAGRETPARLTLALQGAYANLDGILGDLVGPAPLVRLVGSVTPGTRLLTVDDLQISGANAGLSTTGRYGPDTADLRLTGQLGADTRETDALPFQLEAAWSTRLTETGRPRIQLDGTLSDYPALPGAIAGLVTEPVRVSAALVPEAGGAIRLPTFQISTGAAELSGAGRRAANGALILELEGATAAIESGAVAAAPLAIAATVTGPVDDLGFTADLTSETVSAPGLDITSATLNLEGRRTSDAVSSRVTLSGDGVDAPVLAETRVSFADGRLTLAGLSATALGLQLDGSAAANLDAWDTATANLTLTGAPVSVAAASDVDLTASIAGGEVDISGAVSLLALGPTQGGILTFGVQGPLNQLALSSNFDSKVEIEGQRYPLTAALDGDLAIAEAQQPTLTLSPTLSLAELTADTSAPFVFQQLETGQISGGGSLSLLDGTLALDLTPTETGQLASVAYDGIRIAPLLALIERPLRGGTLSGDITLERDMADPSLTRLSAEGEISDLRTPGFEDVAISVVHLLTATGDGLTLDAVVSDAQGLDLTADLSGPLTTAPEWPGLSLQDQATYRYGLEGGGDLSGLAALLAPPAIAASGRAEMSLTGTLPSERGATTGTLSLADGRIEHGDLGFILDTITAEARVDGGALTVDQFAGTGPNGGTLTGAGTYRIGEQSGTLALTAANLSIIDRNDVSARASGALSLDETDDGFAITGDLKIDQADIDTSRINGAGYTTLDVRFPEDGTTDQVVREDRVRLDLDIALTAPRRVFVSGPGLDAEFRLDAAITGPAGDPTIVGEAGIVRGRFDFAGERFVFEESRILITGDPMAAELDLRAVRDAGDVRAIVEITGTPEAPEITLTSEPELPEDEVLSRVLFGRSPTELGALEAAQLASGLASLSGGGGGFNFMADLEDALGLDSLDFSSGADGQPGVTTGKYLSEDVYLEVRTDSTGQPTLIIEWRPRSNLEIEADLTPTEGQVGSIQWRREFD